MEGPRRDGGRKDKRAERGVGVSGRENVSR